MPVDPASLAVIEALGKLDTQDSGLSFDVKVKKSSKIQNVHVAIPAWVFVVAGIVGGASAIVLINEIVKELTGEGFLPELEEGAIRVGDIGSGKNLLRVGSLGTLG